MINNLLKIISEAEIFQLVLLLVLLALIFIQAILKCIFLLKIYRLKNPGKGEEVPVSVLMTVRNEEDNLAQNMPRLLEIESAGYEIVVVDDFSQDNSLSVLGKLKGKNSKLRVSVLNQETRFSAKLAQNIALKSARYAQVLFVPPSANTFREEWLQNISEAISETLDTVVHYSNVENNHTFFNRLYCIETFLLYMKSMFFVALGAPFVYFENNVVFKKEKYFATGGYGQKIKEPYANLELLINQFISSSKCRIALSDKTALRFSEQISQQSFFDLLKKSFRIEQHLANYKRMLLFLHSALKGFIFLFAIAVIVLFTGVWPVVLLAVAPLVILHLFIIKTMQNRLNERKIFIPSLVYELIMPFVKFVFRWHFNRKSRNQKWKSKI
jgi:glycosyltransferase involved in cell wall biosynthesis